MCFGQDVDERHRRLEVRDRLLRRERHGRLVRRPRCSSNGSAYEGRNGKSSVVPVELDRERHVLGGQRLAVVEGRAVDESSSSRSGRPRRLDHSVASSGTYSPAAVDRDRRVVDELVERVRLREHAVARDSGCRDTRPRPMRTVPPVAVPPPLDAAGAVALAGARRRCWVVVQAARTQARMAMIGRDERRGRRIGSVPPRSSGAATPGAGRRSDARRMAHPTESGQRFRARPRISVHTPPMRRG